MKTSRLLALVAAAALALGAVASCDDDGGQTNVIDGGAGDAPRADGPGTPPDAGGGTDAGVTPPRPDGAAGPDGTAAIPLTEWVHDLVTNHTNPSSAADTVEDKNIIDTTDPNAFDSLLQ